MDIKPIRMVLLALSLGLGTWLPLQEAFAAGPAGIEQGLTQADLHAAGLDTLTAAQLRALNALIDARTAQAVAAVPIAARDDGNGPAPVGAGAPRGGVPALGAGAPRDGGSYIGLNDQPIHSRLKGSISSWEPGTEFVLENGQVWKVLKGFYTIKKPMDSPEIVVVPGVAGRWFLQVDEDFPKARVYRID